MAGDERDFRAGDLFRHRACLLGIAGVVLDVQHQFLAEHAAGGVDVGDRLSAPFFICRPKADSPPVIGPATAMVMSCANAAVDSANDAPNARPMSFNDFMRGPRGRSLREVPRRAAGFEDRAIVG